MAQGLPAPQECTSACDPVVTAVPGPAGAAGAAGAAGTNGVNAYTSLTAQFTMPAAQSEVATAARSSNVATIVTQANHDLTTGDTVDITGIVTVGFNATDVTVTVTNATTFTYANTGADIGATAETAGRVDPEETATVADASFLPAGGTPTSFPIVFLQNCGYLELMGISGNVLTLRNPGYTGNIAAAATVAIANKLGMAAPRGLAGAAAASGAPVGAEYWVSQADATLTSERNLGGLASGILKHTVAAGVSTPATATADVDYMSADAGLVNLAGVAMAADKAYYTTADNVHAAMDVTAFARTLLDDATAAAARTTLGLPSFGTIATQNANSVAITGGSITGITDLAVADGGTGVSALSSFRAHRNGVDQASVAGSTDTKVAFDNEDWDVGNGFDTASNRFTPLTAGKYLIVGKVSVKALADADTVTVRIKKNGSTTAVNISQAAGANAVDCLVTDVVDLNGTTDYVEIWFEHSSGANEDLDGTATNSYFSAHWAGQ